MEPVGLGNIRISTNHAANIPPNLVLSLPALSGPIISGPFCEARPTNDQIGMCFSCPSFPVGCGETTSHTRLTACDHYTSSTLIGGEGGAGPSSLHTMLEGPTELCECKMDGKCTWIPTWHQMDRGFVVNWIDFFFKPPLGGRSKTKLGDHGTANAHNCWFIISCHVWGAAWTQIHWNSIWFRVEHIWVHTTLRARDHTTWFWMCVGTAIGHFLLGSHNFMLTSLGSCVKLWLCIILGHMSSA